MGDPVSTLMAAWQAAASAAASAGSATASALGIQGGTAALSTAAAHEAGHLGLSAVAAGATKAAGASVAANLLSKAPSFAMRGLRAAGTLATGAQAISMLTGPRASGGAPPPQMPGLASQLAARRMAGSAPLRPLGGTYLGVKGTPNLAPRKTLLGT